MLRCSLIALLAIGGLAGCARTRQQVGGPTPSAPKSLTLTSTAFAEGEMIPARFTCDGPGISPPLAWTGAPAGTRSYALIVEDPEAPNGTFVHWVIYRIPPEVACFAEDMPDRPSLADGTRQGTNSAGKVGWTPPCPPSGTHRYYFTIYALDNVPDLASGAAVEALRSALQGHTLAWGQLMGRYRKQG